MLHPHSHVKMSTLDAEAQQRCQCGRLERSSSTTRRRRGSQSCLSPLTIRRSAGKSDCSGIQSALNQLCDIVCHTSALLPPGRLRARGQGCCHGGTPSRCARDKHSARRGGRRRAPAPTWFPRPVRGEARVARARLASSKHTFSSHLHLLWSAPCSHIRAAALTTPLFTPGPSRTACVCHAARTARALRLAPPAPHHG
jgi:hypothetical protein